MRRLLRLEARDAAGPADGLAAAARRSNGNGTAAPSPRQHRGWREEVVAAATLNFIAGIWLIIAPWVLGYGTEDPRWNDVVFGAIVALLSLLRLSGAYRETWMSWLNAAIGVWIFIAAFTIDVTSTAGVNDVIVGAIVFVLSIWSATASESRPRLRTARYHPRPPLHHS